MCHPSLGIRDENGTPDELVARLAARDWGVLSIGELCACGLSRDGVMRRVRNGRLHPVHRGVYAVGHTGLTMRGRFLAAVKACGKHAALSHVSAGVLWDLLPYDAARPRDVIARTDRHIAGVNVHRTRHPAVTIRLDNIPVTTPARTLIDLSSMLPFKPLRRAIREATARRRITPHELPPRLQQLMAPTRSELEDLVLDLVTEGGLQAPDINKPLPSGYIPDFRWPEQRLILEADGAAWHDHPLARADDAIRQAHLEADGERVLRVTWAEAMADPAKIVQRLRAAGAPAAARVRGSPSSGPAPRA